MRSWVDRDVLGDLPVEPRVCIVTVCGERDRREEITSTHLRNASENNQTKYERDVSEI